MLRSLPIRYRIIFVLSVVAALLSIPTMGLVLYDLAEQADWRLEDQAAISNDERQHTEVMAALRACGRG